MDQFIRYVSSTYFPQLNVCSESQRQGYGDGSLLTGKVKNLLGDVLYEVVKRHTRARAQVTEEVMQFIRSVILHTSVHSEVHNKHCAAQ